jgi:hypothetical protein
MTEKGWRAFQIGRALIAARRIFSKPFLIESVFALTAKLPA